MDHGYLVSRFSLMQEELDLSRHADARSAVHMALDRLAAVDGHASLAQLRGEPKSAYAYARSLSARRRRISRGFNPTREEFDLLSQAVAVLVAHFGEREATLAEVG